MKKVLALVIVMLMLMAMAPVAFAAGATVYVSVSVDGNLEVTAAPITVTDATVDSAIKAAHAAFYSGGEGGYAAGIDPTWNMFLITKCWGVDGTPYIMLNNAPLGSDPANPATADTAAVVDGDNIIISVSSDMMAPNPSISLKASVNGDSATVTATSWTLDMTTFAYTSSPLAGAAVIDSSNSSLGSTDSNGSITVAVPEDGIIAVDGLAAIYVGGETASAPTTAGEPADEVGEAPAGTTVIDDNTVYVSVSVDGNLEVAAAPISLTDLTVESAMKAVHAEFYSGGEGGYVAGIDATYNMYLITQCWGVAATPYVIVNGAPVGASMADPTVDSYPVKSGDNIVISVSGDPAVPAQAIAMTVSVDGDSATVAATSWVLDFATFSYASSPLAGAAVIDPATGTALGTTDDSGSITVPAGGVVAIDGLSAIPTDGSSASTPDAAAAPATPETPPATPVATGEEITVYVTVSLDGVLQIAAQPVTVNIATADAVIKAAHAQYYSGGESGYATGIDPSFGMFMINTCWGAASTPYVVKNGAPLGTAENVDFISADVMPVAEGDNIILVVSSTGATFPTVSLKLSDDNVLSAQSWVMDFQTFTYTDSPMANYQVVDAETGDVLGETDALGKFKIKKIPDCGVVALTGLAAIPVGEVKSFTPYDGEYIPPVYDYSVFGGPNGRSLLRIVIIGAVLAIPLGIVVIHAQRKELKNRGVKFAKLSDKNTKV